MAVEGDVRVGEVVHEQELALAREVDEPLHLLGGRDRRRRVVRERHDHDARRGSARTASSIAVDVARREAASRRVRRRAGRDEVDRVARASARRPCRRPRRSTHIRWARPSFAPIVLDDLRLGIERDAELLA